MKDNKLKKKLFLILFGLVVVFLFLETGLRISGYIYNSYRIRNSHPKFGPDHSIRILCLGDSFTFGEGAPRGYSYPEQLQAILNNSSSNKFTVYNCGIPGSNSSQLSKNLENNIQKYNPDIIIIMTGNNNCTNFEQSNYFLFTNRSLKVYLYRLDDFLSHMRSYKLFKTT